jgi:hypothetical protein
MRFWLALVYVLLGLSPLPAHAQPSAAKLPVHFSFGLAAGLGDTWMPQSEVPWDLRMQYLAGGVNTGHGWETWNPNATFALNYAQESLQHGYIPMFPYYELVQSNGSCADCPENKKDIVNLNDAALMRAYYANFAVLMKRLGPGTYDGIKGSGGLAMVNVEPDFTGGYAVQAVNNGMCFGFCSGRGNDPSLLQASVNASGYPDVAGLPDTYKGFTQALAHLRDTYAPNVLLGYDVSTWATGDDIGLDTNAAINASQLGQQVGTFLNQLGAHDVLFNDPLDRDAGQYKVQFGQNRWWDRLNVSYPNFTRWEQYLHGTLAADGSRPMLLWQVPAGNQYFQTENNTDGHFQDNRAEYIFGHISELMQAGVIGAIFAPGNTGSTTWGDNMKDGVSNPPSFCTGDGISSGEICNNHTSSVPDDDGGYIRTSAQAYYQSPVALPGMVLPTPTPSPSPTATATPTPAPTATPTPTDEPLPEDEPPG